MTASRNTGEKPSATKARKAPAQKKSGGTRDQTTAKDSSSPRSKSTPTDNQRKSSTAKIRTSTKKTPQDTKTSRSESQKSQSEKKTNDEIASASPASVSASESKKFSTSDKADHSNFGGDYESDRRVSSIFSSIALAIGVLALLMAGYAVYSTQFDSRLERMRQQDQIEFLEERAEAIQSSQNILETSITNLRLNSAELEVENQERVAELREQIATQENSIRQLNAVSLEELTSQVESFQADLDSLSQEVNQTRTYFQDGVESWTLKEVEYLLLIANHQLRMTGENDLIVEALETASVRLGTLANPNYFEVKGMLDQNIQALKTRTSVDTLSLLGNIRILNGRISYLPVLGDLSHSGSSKTNSQGGNAGPSVPITTQQQSEEATNALSEALSRFLNSISDLIQIEKNNRPVRPVISGELRQLIYERTHLLLELAESALIRQQHVLVAERLNLLRNWVSDSYDMNADITIEWIGMLDAIIKNLTVSPPLDLSETIATLQDVMDS